MALDLNDIIEKMREKFVTYDVFNLRLSPLEKVVYGFVSIVLATVVTAGLYLVIRK